MPAVRFRASHTRSRGLDGLSPLFSSRLYPQLSSVPPSLLLPSTFSLGCPRATDLMPALTQFEAFELFHELPISERLLSFMPSCCLSISPLSNALQILAQRSQSLRSPQLFRFEFPAPSRIFVFYASSSFALGLSHTTSKPACEQLRLPLTAHLTRSSSSQLQRASPLHPLSRFSSFIKQAESLANNASYCHVDAIDSQEEAILAVGGKEVSSGAV